MKRIVLFMVLVVWCFGAKGQGWFELGNLRQWGTGVSCIISDSLGNIYAAGALMDSPILAYITCYVAKWDHMTHQWSELGTGSNKLLANSGIDAMVMDKHGNIYVGGNFTDSMYAGSPQGDCYVAKWDGTTWSELGTGVNGLNAKGPINTMCIDDSGNIFVAGQFRDHTGQSYVAKWNGATWSELYGLNTGAGFIYSVCVDDRFSVYAAGGFADASGHVYVAKYTPATSSWSELGSGFDSGSYELTIQCIITDTPDHVYAALNCDSWATTSNIFKWDGASWSQLGALNANFFTLSLCKGDSGCVYASGLFSNATGMKYVAKWSPQTNNWSQFGYLDATNGIGGLYMDKSNNLYASGEYYDSATLSNYFYVAEYGISTLEVKPIAIDYDIKVYPNPARDHVNLTYSAITGMGFHEYYIYDDVGRECLKGKLNELGNTAIDVSVLPPGVFLLSVGYKIFNITIY